MARCCLFLPCRPGKAAEAECCVQQGFISSLYAAWAGKSRISEGRTGRRHCGRALTTCWVKQGLPPHNATYPASPPPPEIYKIYTFAPQYLEYSNNICLLVSSIDGFLINLSLYCLVVVGKLVLHVVNMTEKGTTAHD